CARWGSSPYYFDYW
nr:immunoglobulin heavy chain junction region [Mus musculus]